MKKLLLSLSVLVCALCCVFGFAACENPDDQKVKASATANEYIKEVEIFKGTTYNYDTFHYLYDRYGSQSVSLEKGSLYTIRVLMYNRYGLGNMKMLINDTETALDKSDAYQNTSLVCYSCEYTPDADFEVKFRGAAERKAVNIQITHENGNEWESRITHANDIRVRILVNNAAAAEPFKNDESSNNSIALKDFIRKIADNPLPVKADDQVDIYIFSASSAYKTTTGMLSISPSSLEFNKETYKDSFSGVHFGFKVLSTDISLKLSTHANDLRLAQS